MMNRQGTRSRVKGFLKREYGITVFLLILSGGCKVVGPDYTRPEIVVPPQWPSGESGDVRDATGASGIGTEALAEWWTTLEDPVLTSLVERAQSNNNDLRIAVTRIRRARARLGISEKQRDPSVSASAQYRRTQSGAPTPGNDDSSLFNTGSNYYWAGFDAAWEADLFGKQARNIEAAVAELQSSEEGFRDVQISLVSEVVSNYVRLRTFQQQLEIVLRNLALQEEVLDVQEALAEAGLISFLQVQQSRYNIESTRSRIPGHKIDVEASLNTLAILLGEMPGSLHQELETPGPVPAPNLEITIGIPADILRRRPDIRLAERELAAQTARIGVATAELYPSFHLSGSLGMTAGSLSSFFSDDSPGISIIPFISIPLFNRDKIRDQIEIENALQEQYLIEYENVVLAAIKEVRDAIISYGEEQKRYMTLEKGALEAREALNIAREQFRTGLVAFIDVLDAQRALLSFEETQISSKGNTTQDLIRLYKALGGGWKPEGP